MEELASHLRQALMSCGWQLGVLCGPVIVACVILHHLDKALDERMAALTGRGRIYITGWIGTPIHELSHAVACVLFRHEVREIQLFKPDRDGRLGFVRHAYDPKNPYHIVGNFFIGIAPLFGGALVILALVLFLHPDPAVVWHADFEHVLEGDGALAIARGLYREIWHVRVGLLGPALYSDWRFWAFVYLSFAIGSHLAPSRADLEGGARGGLLFLALLLALNVAATYTSLQPSHFYGGVRVVMVPLFAVLLLAITLNSVWLTVVGILARVVGR